MYILRPISFCAQLIIVKENDKAVNRQGETREKSIKQAIVQANHTGILEYPVREDDNVEELRRRRQIFILQRQNYVSKRLIYCVR